jgi:hypothetical protein
MILNDSGVGTRWYMITITTRRTLSSITPDGGIFCRNIYISQLFCYFAILPTPIVIIVSTLSEGNNYFLANKHSVWNENVNFGMP